MWVLFLFLVCHYLFSCSDYVRFGQWEHLEAGFHVCHCAFTGFEKTLTFWHAVYVVVRALQRSRATGHVRGHLLRELAIWSLRLSSPSICHLQTGDPESWCRKSVPGPKSRNQGLCCCKSLSLNAWQQRAPMSRAGAVCSSPGNARIHPSSAFLISQSSADWGMSTTVGLLTQSIDSSASLPSTSLRLARSTVSIDIWVSLSFFCY
jgi:hypothetical protein